MKLKSVGFKCNKCNRELLSIEFVSVVKISSYEFILFCSECGCHTTYLIAKDKDPAILSFGLDEVKKNTTKLFVKKIIEN